MKIGQTGMPTFLLRLMKHWESQEHKIVRVSPGKLPTDLDLLWIEWSCGEAIQASKQKTKYPKVIRIHRGDCVDTKNCQQINWKNIDQIVFIAPHIKRHFEANYKTRTPKVLIPNAVDVDDFSFVRHRVHSDVVGVLGNLIPRKDYDFAFDVVKRTEMRLWARGDVTASQLDYAKRVKAIFNKTRRWEFFRHRFSRIQAFYNTIDIILSTSLDEGLPLNILEGMSCGCHPVIRDWEGANELFPPEYLFHTIEEAAELVRKWHRAPDFAKDRMSREARKHIVESYNFETQAKNTDRMIASLLR